MRTSQAATEFIVFIGLAIVILVGYLVISNNFMNLTIINKDNKLARDLALELKNELNLAGLSYDGYQKNYTLPPNINNKNYTVSIPSGEREVTVILEGNHYTESLATEIYEGMPEISPNQKISIRNSQGLVNASIDCNQENLNLEICGTDNQCFNVPNNDGCVVACQADLTWRVLKFCDGAGCSNRQCGTPITYLPCQSSPSHPLSCDNIYGNQGCANSKWEIIGICNNGDPDLADICCQNPGQSNPVHPSGS